MLGFLFRRKRDKADKPWLRKKHWADGRIPSAYDAASPRALAVVGLVCAGLSVGAVLLKSFGDRPDIQWGGIGVAAFFAVVFFAGAFYTRALRAKFGRTWFKLNHTPGRIGGELAGTIQLEKALHEPGTLQVTLRCLMVIPKRKDTDSPRAEILWEDRQAISTGANTVGRHTDYEVRFPIPHDAKPTDDPDSRRRIYWELAVTAHQTGLDFNASFVVPVYRVEDWPEPART